MKGLKNNVFILLLEIDVAIQKKTKKSLAKR